MSTEFLDLAKIGRHQCRTYLLGWVFILILAEGRSRLKELIVCSGRDPQTAFDSGILERIYSQIYGLAGHVNFTALSIALCVFLVVRLLYQQPFRRILTANNRLNWKLLAQGFALYFLFLLVMATLTGYLVDGSSFLTGAELPHGSGTAAIGLIGGTILSAAAEEVFCRGYILQGLGLLTQNRILLASASGFLFAVHHLPLAGSNEMLFLLACFEIGFYLALLTLKSNGLELAIGMHSAHNFALTLTHHIRAYQMIHFTILFPISAVIMYLILFGRKTIQKPATQQSPNAVEDSGPHQSKIWAKNPHLETNRFGQKQE